MVTAPPAQRDAAAAVGLARRAVKLAPSEPMYHNTLGVALYRAGQYREAVAELRQSLSLGGGKWDAFDLYFLALCYQKLGERDQAVACFRWAVEWHRQATGLTAEHRAELAAFRAEATTELGLPVP